ncbi:MAG: hypothetical protein ACYC6B_01585 [Thermoleophilia bacterium]
MTTLPDSRSAAGHRLLIISGTTDFDAVTETGSAWDLARSLASDHDVILAVPEVTRLSHPRFAVVYYNARNLGLLVRDSDVAVFGRGVFAGYPSLREMGELKTAPAPAVRAGALDGGSPFPVDRKTLDEVAQDELFLLIPFKPAVATGISLYLKRIRRRLRQGGVRRASVHGGAGKRRKISGN